VDNAFFRAGYIESWGRGIEKINRACREHGIESPVWDFGMAGLMLTFRANPAHLKAAAQTNVQPGLDEKLDEKLGVKRAAIVRLMGDNPRITVTELANALKISRTAADNNIQKLKSLGRIRRHGAAKGGHWEVLR
jgi:ATP-dependent DNA helicase RecG